MAMQDWSAIEGLGRTKLTDLFANDPERLGKLSVDVGGIHFDFAKTHLDDAALDAFAGLATTMELAAKRDALFAGQAINVTEGRSATHTAERGEGSAEDVAQARAFQSRMRAVIDAIEAEAFGPVRHILHVGIFTFQNPNESIHVRLNAY